MRSLTHTTLIQEIWSGESALVKNITLAVLGSLALWVSAKISIPFWPVPLTMQTLVVLTIGMAFGWKLGASTILLYLAEGAIGLPVFSGTPEKGMGLVYMLGTTGGYLVGFVFAAAAVGWLAQKGWDRNPITTALAMLIGTAIIYVFGILWLGSIVGWDKPVLAWGLIPFLPGDMLKLILATAFMPTIWKLVSKRDA